MDVFIKNPIKVTVLGVDILKKTFEPKVNIVFVGNIPRDVEKALNIARKDVNSSDFLTKDNPVLKKFYGLKWREKLGLSTDIKIGGDSFESFDGGDEDEDTLIDIKENTIDDIDIGDDLFGIEDSKTKTLKNKKEDKKDDKKGDKKDKKDKKDIALLEKEVLKKNISDESDITDGIKPSKPVKLAEKVEISKSSKGLSVDLIFIKDISIYPEDKVSDFKEKLYAASIEMNNPYPIYKQHIFFNSQGRTIPLRYKIISDSDAPVNILELFNPNNKIISDIPIDYELYMNRESISVQAFDTAVTMLELYKSYGTTHFYTISVDDFIGNRKGILDGMFKKDKLQFKMIYYGFIIKFWPMITEEVYKDYITNEKDIQNIYSDLHLSPKKILSTIQSEKDILEYKYELFTDAWNGFINNPKFKLYVPFIEDTKIPKESMIKVSIRSSTLTVDKSKIFIKGRIEYFNQTLRLDVRNLLDCMDISDIVPLIRAKIIYEGSPIEVTKKRSPKAKGFMKKNEEDIQRIYESVKSHLRLNYYNTALLVVRVPDKLLQTKNIKTDELGKYMILTIFDNGKYMVKSTWEENIEINFSSILNIMKQTIDPVISMINNLGHKVFSGNSRLSYIDESNSEFTDLTVNIFWKKTISRTSFEYVKKTFNDDIISGIIKKSDLIDTEDQGTIYFKFMKGITELDISAIEKVKPNNYYRYLSDGKFKQRWINIFENGRDVSVIHRSTDIKIEVQGMKEKEFSIFYQYIISKLYKIDGSVELNTKNIKSDDKEYSKHNVLKLLKSRDPEAFDFKKYGSPLVYSRICQKKLQPIPYTDDELQKMPNNMKAKAVEYWNFTTQKPMWYICPNAKYPYMSFIPKQHPKGFCLPCCKKTPAYEIEGSDCKKSKNLTTKKGEIYSICMKEHVYMESDSIESADNISRYIMNYGKPVEIGRIGRLPDIIEKYLLYNLEDKSDNEDIMDNYYNYNDKKYSVVKIIKATKNIKIREIPIKNFEHFMNLSKFSGIKKSELFTPNEVLKNPSLSPSGSRLISLSNPTDPILVHKIQSETPESEKMENFNIVHGYHILAKAFSENAKSIFIKIVTDKQLEKVSSIKSKKSDISNISNKKTDKTSDKKGGDSSGRIINIRKFGYYVYGVYQDHPNINNIGAIYSLASVFDTTIDKFIINIIKLINGNKSLAEYYFNIFLKGRLPLYFRNIQHLISTMTFLFLNGPQSVLKDESDISYKFIEWNELFIDIVQILYKKVIIIIRDSSVNTSGTSIKQTDINENIEIILSNKVEHLNDIIPQDTTIEYILLLERGSTSNNLSGQELKIYYPIYVFMPQTFFKSSVIEKKIYTNNDEIMKLIENLLIPGFEKQKLDIIDLKILLNFIDNQIEKGQLYNIAKIYINNKNLCYAVLLVCGSNVKDKKFIYLPLNYSIYTTVPDKYLDAPLLKKNQIYSYSPFNRNKFSLDFTYTKKFISDYNMYVVELSESKGLYKIVVENIESKRGIESREAKIIPAIPLMKISEILILINWGDEKPKSNTAENNQIVIGFVCNGLSYYVNDITLEKFNNIASKDYKIITNDTIVKYIYYDPNKVNEIIYSHTKSDDNKLNDKLIAKSIYNKYAYQLFMLELMGYFDKEINTPLRKKITTLISKTNFNDSNSIDAFKKELEILIGEFPDYEKVQSQINLFYSTHFDKKRLINDIGNTKYHFDKSTLIDMRNMTRDYMSMSIENKKIGKEKVIKILRDVVNKVIQINDTNIVINDIPNILVACDSTSENYCKKGKLVIMKDKIESYIDMFFEDFINPLKRPYIMSSILLKNTVDYFNFRKNPGEDIYVKY